ncbi:right-handed parallel beta-helix repeat-containing protein [Actinomadura spongiicola]|uniref:Right-handed parallel beta-helix repeat-containing protein n=2 Tax=Actinomadura spongiicola TaxID=2303421 RepID=A0A372GA49_9ACTN|nr:right-handed parallel beta-helix repeat-containing protein [Actinomadura spongiicola]
MPSSAAARAGERPEQLYVAPWGKDTWPGSIQRPFATPARAQKAVRERTAEMASDIVVNFRAGTYGLAAPLALTEAAGDSGRNGHRVVYQAYGYGTSRQEKVTVSGGRSITGWRPDETLKGFWRADVGELDLRQLYVNDRRASRLVRGNSGLAGKLKVTKSGYTTTSPIPRTWRNPADIEFVYRYAYVEGRCGVAGISGDAEQTTITMDQPCWDMLRKLYGPETPQEWFEVENSPSFSSKPGSWYLDRSGGPGRHVLLYRPRAGEDMSRVQVTAPVLQTLVSGTGRAGRPLHDVAFRGLTFAHATWLAPSEPAGFAAAWSMYMRPAKNGDMTPLTVPGNVAFRTAERISIQGNRFVHLGAQALEFSENSSSNVVDGNVITDTSDGGILMGVVPPDMKGVNRGNRISNNWIHGTGADYRASSAIWDTATQQTTIAHNQVNDVPYIGILSGPSEDLRGIMHGNRILNNRVFRTNRLLADGGGIYLRGEQGTSYADGAVISGNAVTESKFNPDWNVGIYTDDSSRWMTVDRNVVYDYAASIGGCSEEWGDRPVQDVRFRGNFWDDAVPSWLERKDYPGAWPPADEQNPEEGCGEPRDLQFADNTKLNPATPDQACADNPGCAAIIHKAGLLPSYRHLLNTP